MPSEGQTATGPNGEKAVFRGGQWVPMPSSSAPSSGGVFSLPVSAQQAAQTASTQTTTAGNAIANQISAASAPATISKAGSDAVTAQRTASTAGLPEGYMWNADGTATIPIPGYSRQGLSPEIRKGAMDVLSDADAIAATVADLRRQYEVGPGSTKGTAGLRDYLPTTTNKIFNDTGQRARGYVKRALGFTGGEGNTIAESASLYDPYLPSADDRDEQILAKIDALEALGKQARQKAIGVLGGVPDENGRIVPVAPQSGPQSGPTPLNGMIYQGGDAKTAAAEGAQSKLVDLPPDYQAAVDSYIASGRFTPEGYAQLRAALDRTLPGGMQALDQSAEYERFAREHILPVLQRGGTIKNIPGMELRMSEAEQLRHDMIANPVGTGVANFADAATLGTVSALAPEQMGAASDMNWKSALTGQVLGSIAGTEGLGFLGRNTVGRIAPVTMGGGDAASLARGIGADTIYSGIYGNNTGHDPVASALLGAGGSLAGRGTGNIIGYTIGGVPVSAAVQTLREAGVPLTVGQTLGGIPKTIEDAFTSVPGVGDLVNARRYEGLDALFTAAANEAGAPIGAVTRETGEAGINELRDAVGQAYTNATAGARVPLDQQFFTDMGAVAQQGARLPNDYAAAFDTIGQNRIQPIIDAGEMTGTSYQQSRRGLQAARNSADQVGNTGFENEYRAALTGAMDALEGNMMRGGGDDVVAGLLAANTANRSVETLADASSRAAAGRGGEGLFIPTPNQLQRAGIRTAENFPGPRPFADLADAAQQVLPSYIPDSGTGRRLAQMAVPAALTGTGGGVGFLASGDENGAVGAGTGALSGLGIAALLMLGGTRGGQQLINAALTNRPGAAEAIGEFVANNNRISGRAFIPLALPIAADQ